MHEFGPGKIRTRVKCLSLRLKKCNAINICMKICCYYCCSVLEIRNGVLQPELCVICFKFCFSWTEFHLL